VTVPALALLPVLALLTVAASLWGLWFVQSGRAREATLVGALAPTGESRFRALVEFTDRLDGRLRATALGQRLADRLRAALVPLRAVDALGLALVAAAAVVVVVTSVVTLPLALVFTGALLATGWFVLGRLRERRLYAFVLQLPDLARLLANAASSGLALPSAIDLAASELEEPAGTELRIVVEQTRFGLPLQQALADLEERMASREVRVLTRTLLLQYRLGGDLVAALRSLATTLDARRDVVREVQTLLAPSRNASVVVGVLGLGSLVLIETLRRGTISAMVTSPIGIAALVVAGLTYLGAFRIIGRITKLDL